MNTRTTDTVGWRTAGQQTPRPKAGGQPDWTAEERSAWVLRARRGDLRAQSEIVRRYGVRIAGFVRPMLRQRESVEDAVQVVMIKMVRQLPRLREPERFEPWLFTLARNAVFDQLRRRRCRPEAEWDDSEWRRQPDPGANDRSAEVVEALDRATRGFTPAERRVMDRVVAGWSYQAIAAEENLNLGALKVRIHRMRCLLRQRLPALLGMPERTAAPATPHALGASVSPGRSSPAISPWRRAASTAVRTSAASAEAVGKRAGSQVTTAGAPVCRQAKPSSHATKRGVGAAAAV